MIWKSGKITKAIARVMAVFKGTLSFPPSEFRAMVAQAANPGAGPTPMTQPLDIVFAIYPGVTHLDFTGPHQVLSALPGARTIVASVNGGEITADGLTFGGLARLA